MLPISPVAWRLVARIIVKGEAGTTLATVERSDVFDIGDMMRTGDGSDVFVLRDTLEIDPAAGTETQIVIVGRLRAPASAAPPPGRESRKPGHISISLGRCAGWTLQRASATAYSFVRCVDEAEAEQIEEAADFCRKYVTNPVHDLLRSTYRAWRQAYQLVSEDENWTPDTADYLQGAFVGWLLAWRLVIDQARHDVRAGFGDDSNEFRRLEAARHKAHGESVAYRLTEAMRNAVTHREIPPLRLHRNRQRNPATNETITVSTYTFPVSYLLNWRKCPGPIKREFASSPHAEFSVPEIIDEAMRAIDGVLLEMIKAWTPDINRRILYLRGLFSETEPDLPVLISAVRPLAGSRVTGGINLRFRRLDDLAYVVRNSPVSLPAPQQAADGEDAHAGAPQPNMGADLGHLAGPSPKRRADLRFS